MSFADLQSAAPGVAWVPLADTIAKASILFAAAGLVSVALRRGSAAARHMVWTLALLSALALPFLSISLPRWQLALVTFAAPAAPEAASATETPRAAPPVHTTASAVRAERSAAAPSLTSETNRASVTRFAMPQIPWSVLLFVLWAAGAAVLLLRVGVGLIAVQWMSRNTDRVTDAPWLPLARELAADLGLSRGVVFLRSRRAAMPMAWGILRPSVLMPADADAWPADRLRIVLLHELAHVKRRDCLTHLLAQLSCALYWFNPLAWIAAKHVRMERERACDDLVLAAGTPGADYADQLIEVARVMRAGRFPSLVAGASLAMAHRSQLEGRLLAILDPTVPRAAVSRRRTAAATAMFALGVMPLASLQPWAIASERAAVDLSTPDVSVAPQARPAPDPAPMVEAAAVNAAQSGSETVVAKAQASAQSAVEATTVQGRAETAAQPSAAADTDDAADKDEAQDEKARGTDPRTVAALTAALKDTDKDVRETALHALVQLRDPSIFGPLVQALTDAAADVREQAAFGLGQLRDRRAVEPLIGALKDQNPDVREQAAFALGQIRDRSAVPGLTAALKDTDDDVREQAVFALGQLRDPVAVEALITATRDAKPDVREQAVFALGQIRDRRAVEPLISALKDAAPDVRQQAAFGLGHIRDRAAVEALVVALKDSAADVREQVAFALGQLRDPRAIDGLTAALKDQSADVRQQAAFALGQIR